MSHSSCHDLDIGKFQKLLSSSQFSSSPPKKHLQGKFFSEWCFSWLFCFSLSLPRLQLCWCHPGVLSVFPDRPLLQTA